MSDLRIINADPDSVWVNGEILAPGEIKMPVRAGDVWDITTDPHSGTVTITVHGDLGFTVAVGPGEISAVVRQTQTQTPASAPLDPIPPGGEAQFSADDLETAVAVIAWERVRS